MMLFGLVLFQTLSAGAVKEKSMAPGKADRQGSDNIEQQVKTLTDNYLALSANLSKVIKEKELLATENAQTNEKLESAIRSNSELTIENQSLKNSIKELKNQPVNGSCNASQEKVKILEDKINQLQRKLQALLSLLPKPSAND